MIDFHTHILHHIDDGSHNVEESIAMLKMSYAQGIDTVVLSSHFRRGENSIVPWLEERRLRFEQIRESLTEEDKKLIPRMVMGAEIEFMPDMNRWDYLDKLTINGTKYIMTEMPFTPWTESNVKVIDDIALNTPFTPVIPHIDRYFHTFTPTKYIEHFYNMPVVIQMNAIYINGVHNVQFYKPLFESGKIQILGSDCHSAEWRQPDLGPAISRLREVCSDEIVDRIDAYGRNMMKDAVYEEV
ncbi:MAG: CpsB/CapC family capsule biosynthesis tyrosine phosphatase [Anaerovoracaceae bacterium]|jgi:protein-tyrosine phosphatase